MSSTDRPYIKEEDVTPQLAQQYLGKSAGNRNLKKRAVQRYARDMIAGKWEMNGEAIKFDRSGALVDGHHRLHAITMAEKTVRMLVVRGLKLGSMLTIDTGAARSFADSQAVLGHGPVPTALSSGLRWWWMYENGLLFASTPATHTELALVLEKHPHIAESARYIGNLRVVRSRCTPGLQCFAHAYTSAKYDREMADQFWRDLNDGAGLEKTSPIYLLRGRLVDTPTIVRYQPTFVLALTIKAWNAWIAGKKMQVLRWSTEGDHPEPFPFFSVDEKRMTKMYAKRAEDVAAGLTQRALLMTAQRRALARATRATGGLNPTA